MSTWASYNTCHRLVTTPLMKPLDKSHGPWGCTLHLSTCNQNHGLFTELLQHVLKDYTYMLVVVLHSAVCSEIPVLQYHHQQQPKKP